jgi:hypothetical protein
LCAGRPIVALNAMQFERRLPDSYIGKLFNIAHF